MIVTPDHLTVISGSVDKKIIIWTITGIILHTLTQQETITGLYLTKDKKYLITMESHKMSYWQKETLCLMFQQEFNQAN